MHPIELVTYVGSLPPRRPLPAVWYCFRYSRAVTGASGRGGNAFSEITEVPGWGSVFGVSSNVDSVLGVDGQGYEGACHSDCSSHTGTHGPHTGDSWFPTACLDTLGIPRTC